MSDPARDGLFRAGSAALWILVAVPGALILLCVGICCMSSIVGGAVDSGTR